MPEVAPGCAVSPRVEVLHSIPGFKTFQTNALLLHPRQQTTFEENTGIDSCTYRMCDALDTHILGQAQAGKMDIGEEARGIYSSWNFQGGPNTTKENTFFNSPWLAVRIVLPL